VVRDETNPSPPLVCIYGVAWVESKRALTGRCSSLSAPRQPINCMHARCVLEFSRACVQAHVRVWRHAFAGVHAHARPQRHTRPAPLTPRKASSRLDLPSDWPPTATISGMGKLSPMATDVLCKRLRASGGVVRVRGLGVLACCCALKQHTQRAAGRGESAGVARPTRTQAQPLHTFGCLPAPLSCR